MNATFRKVRCACGNDSFYRTRDFDAPGDGSPIWECANCRAVTPRREVSRRSLQRIAFDLYCGLVEEWKSTNEALRLLVDHGAASGCLLVHTSTFNYSLRTLAGDHGKLTRARVRVAVEQARRDLVAAKAFVEEQITKEVLCG